MSKFFSESSLEERDHAEKFMTYQAQRGGRAVLRNITAPESHEWGSALNGLTTALALEKKVNQSLLYLHKLADSKRDPHLTDFLEGNFLNEQVESIKKISDMITRLKRATQGSRDNTGLGEYLFDKELQ